MSSVHGKGSEYRTYKIAEVAMKYRVNKAVAPNSHSGCQIALRLTVCEAEKQWSLLCVLLF